MIERVWSSMNSTRTWVTPPREPKSIIRNKDQPFFLSPSPTPSLATRGEVSSLEIGGRFLFRTGTAEDAGDLHELDGLLRGIHFDRCGISRASAKKSIREIGILMNDGREVARGGGSRGGCGLWLGKRLAVDCLAELFVGGREIQIRFSAPFSAFGCQLLPAAGDLSSPFAAKFRLHRRIYSV